MQHFDSQIDKSNFQPAQKAKQKNSNIQTIFRSFSLLVRSAGQIRNRSEWYAIRSKPVAGLTKRVRFWATADQFERSDFRIVFRSLQIHTDRISFFYFKLQAEVNIFKMAKILISTIYQSSELYISGRKEAAKFEFRRTRASRSHASPHGYGMTKTRWKSGDLLLILLFPFHEHRNRFPSNQTLLFSFGK